MSYTHNPNGWIKPHGDHSATAGFSALDWFTCSLTSKVTNTCWLALWILPVGLFLISVFLTLWVFQLNADYLGMINSSSPNDEQKKILSERIRSASLHSKIFFGLAVLTTVLFVVVTTINQISERQVSMGNENKPNRGTIEKRTCLALKSRHAASAAPREEGYDNGEDGSDTSSGN